MTGIWKNYDELEESISMPELLSTLEARREQGFQEHRFLAALQGVQLPEPGADSFDDLKMKAEIIAAGGNPEVDDVKNIQGGLAAKRGFGINVEQGLSYGTA